MTIYRYNAGSLIDEVRVVTNATGGHRAYLHARSDATPEQLAEIKQRFSTLGWKTIPYSENGQPLLEVRGFKKAEEFTDYLSNHGWVSGQATIAKLKSDVVTAKEKFSNLTLKLAGFVYLISDFCYMKYATKGLGDERKKLAELERNPTASNFNKMISTQKEAITGEKFNIGAGIGYAMGSASLAFFGNKDQSQNQIRNASKKIHTFMTHEGVAIDNNASLENNRKKQPRSFLEKIGDFGRRYPSEILNVVYIGVGALITARSFKKIASMKARGEKVGDDVIDTGLGIVTAASAFAGLVIKEKKREPGEKRRSGLAGVWDWIQEKPLRATGYGYMISTMFHAVATIGKYRKGDASIRSTIGWRGGFVVGNIVSEILVAISSKGHGVGVSADHSTDDTVLATTAEMISKQNPTYQKQLIEQLAGYMTSPEILGGKAERISQQLQERVAAIYYNPWANTPKPTKMPAILVSQAPMSSTHPKTTVSADSVERTPRKMLPPVEMDTTAARV